MAEVFGVAVGVVGITGFAGQIAGGVVKLNGLYRVLKNADQELLDLADDLSNFATVLESIEAHHAQFPTPMPSYLVQCYHSCRALVAKLTTLIQRLEQDIKHRRSFGKIKFALKRTAVKDLRDALTRAQQPLQLGLWSFSSVINQQAWREVRSELKGEFQSLRNTWPNNRLLDETQSNNSQTIAFAVPEEKVDALVHNPSEMTARTTPYRRRARSREDNTTPHCVLSLTWLGKRWVIETKRLYQGWNLNLRTYNVVPRNSPVFIYATTGDVAGLRVLFENKLASPFDRDSIYGETPLHFAAHGNEAEAVRFLIDQGAEVDARDWDNETPFEHFWWYYDTLYYSGEYEDQRSRGTGETEVSETLRILADESEILCLLDSRLPVKLILAPKGDGGSSRLFLQRNLYPSYEDVCCEDRVESAFIACYPWLKTHCVSADLFWSTLGQTELYSIPSSDPYLIWVAIITNLAISRYEKDVHLQTWRTALTKLVAAWPGLLDYLLDDFNDVPSFQEWLDGASFKSEHDKISAQLNRLWQDWIEELKVAGVNVKGFSQTLSNLVSIQGSPLEFTIGCKAKIKVRVLSAVYCTNIEDCRLWVSWPLDEWAGEFWNWVENPEIHIPGSWVEDKEGDGEWMYRYLPLEPLAILKPWDKYLAALPVRFRK